jgi:hypothetical protein
MDSLMSDYSLMSAPTEPLPQVAKVLLKHDKSVIELRDNEGRSCLHWSAKTETTKCIELLLKNAPPMLVNVQDHENVRSVLCRIPASHSMTGDCSALGRVVRSSGPHTEAGEGVCVCLCVFLCVCVFVCV